MPRGSKPGERRGGRQRGTPNKTTALTNAAMTAAAADPNLLPLDFLLGVMRDPNVQPDIRIKAALGAAPFVHLKPRRDPGDAAASAKLIDADASPEERGRRRIGDLQQQKFLKPLTADEQSELDSLQALYPVHLDPVWKAFLEVKAKMAERSD